MNTVFEEGGKCPECEGSLYYPKVRGCSCHINPPCSACTDQRLQCDTCDWEESEPEPTPPPTQAERDGWAKWLKEWEEARQRGHTLPGGGRIFDIHDDGRSGSTMVITGRYEGDVTAAEIFAYFGDGTFGHRGPTLANGRFSYTKITD
jgi:hypothetical protein